MEKNKKTHKKPKKHQVPPEQQATRDWYIEVYCKEKPPTDEGVSKAKREFLA